MSKKFQVDVTVPQGLMEGDIFTIEIELPEKAKRKGMLAGLSLEEMTDEQLKRELINANSVLYKAKQRNASEEIIAANEARVAAAKAEKAKRTPVPDAVVVAAAVDASLEVDEKALEEL